MNVGIISKDKNGLLKAKTDEEEWSADSEPDSPPSPGTHIIVFVVFPMGKVSDQ